MPCLCPVSVPASNFDNEVCEGYVFTRVCHSVHKGGGGVIYQYALQVSRPTPGGELRGLAWGVSRPTPGGGGS